MINLFVDDVREVSDVYPFIPYDNWIICRTSGAALEVLESCVEIATISLDHDLGENDTIEPVLTHLQKMAFNGGKLPRQILPHSDNPVGIQKIRAVVEFVERYR